MYKGKHREWKGIIRFTAQFLSFGVSKVERKKQPENHIDETLTATLENHKDIKNILATNGSEKPLLAMTNDYVFKKVMVNVTILASFLSAYFGIDIKPEDVNILNPNIGPIKPGDKIGILDIKLKLTINSQEFGQFDIEMHLAYHKNLWKRFQYYVAKVYVEEIKSSEDYFKLIPAYGIIILEDNIIPDKQCHHRFRLYDEKNQCSYHDSIEIHFLELSKKNSLCDSKYIKNSKQLKELQQWLNFFASKSEAEYMEAVQGNTQLENALGIIRQISMDDNEREIAESVAKARGEELAQYHAGYDDGKQEGIDLGKEEGKQELVKIMLQKNVPIETIISFTDLSREYILSVKK
ncbi:MAG: Rpn family recombination-promoting nuclease/putative transposase [Desulfovibrionaceae bacterium]|nr:Rpn family recombination-promoting nuclease/putative transposase [Desulfovibrionaceae bacterium]